MKLVFGTGTSFGLLNRTKAEFLVNFAITHGITKFDTGVNYGNWKSQPLLGSIIERHIKNEREKFQLTSKAGTHSTSLFKYTKNFNPDYVESMIYRSISELKCFYLDKFYLHCPNLEQLETKGLIDKLKNLKSKGLIKKIGVNTHDLSLMKRISLGTYDEIESILIDFNLLQQNRATIFQDCKKNNISISSGNSLFQGLLVQSTFDIFKKRNIFYIARLIQKKSLRNNLNKAMLTRKFLKNKYKKEYKSIPLSFVLNNPYIDSVPIGMLNKKSIERNILIEKKKVENSITKYRISN